MHSRLSRPKKPLVARHFVAAVTGRAHTADQVVAAQKTLIAIARELSSPVGMRYDELVIGLVLP